MKNIIIVAAVTCILFGFGCTKQNVSTSDASSRVDASSLSDAGCSTDDGK